MARKCFVIAFLFVFSVVTDVFAETVVTPTTTTTTTVTKKANNDSDIYIKNTSSKKTDNNDTDDSIYYYRKPRLQPDNDQIENALIFGSGVAVGALLQDYYDDNHHRHHKPHRPSYKHFRY
jgi:hypothetical protein